MVSPIEHLAKNFSFSSFKKAEDLKKRLLFTLFILVIYRLGTYIPLPNINPGVVSEFTRNHAGGLFGILDMFSGGAIGRMTVFSLNIMPYISASIIVQLVT
jgi:preprotein translocase subunit SecY